MAGKVAVTVGLLLAGCVDRQAIQQSQYQNDSAICQAYSGGHGGYEQCMANAGASLIAADATAAQQQDAARRAAMMQAGIAMATGGGAPAPAPMPNILPAPPLRCTSSRDYMGQIHTICQ